MAHNVFSKAEDGVAFMATAQKVGQDNNEDYNTCYCNWCQHYACINVAYNTVEGLLLEPQVLNALDKQALNLS